MTHNPPATEGLAAGLAEFVRETAWVIENTLPNQPEYFCGGKAGRSFSPDHMQAIRFIRREDAAACADFFPISQAIHAEVREHIWLEPAALSVPAAEQKAEPFLTGRGWENLTCDDQFILAKRIASNIGYTLTPEPSISEAEDRADDATGLREIVKTCREHADNISPSGYWPASAFTEVANRIETVIAAEQKAEPVRKVQKMARFCAEIAWDTAFAWAIDHGRTDQEAYDAASSVRENVLVHALQDDALSTQAIEARNAVIVECGEAALARLRKI